MAGLDGRYTAHEATKLFRGPQCALIVASILDFAATPDASADDVLVSPPLCEVTFGSSGGQNADVDLDTNTAFSRADGGAATEHSSHAELGLFLTPATSLTATVQVGASWGGILRGSLGTNTIYGTVKVTARLHDETNDVEVGSQVLLNQKEDGAAFETINTVVASDPFNGPFASFANVNLVANHQYSATLEVETTAKGLQGKSDFKDSGFVRFGCVAILAPLVDSDGDGHTVNDIQGATIGTADFDFQLRAERAGSGDGRIYTVTYTATDACGLSTEGVAEVLVPHN